MSGRSELVAIGRLASWAETSSTAPRSVRIPTVPRSAALDLDYSYRVLAVPVVWPPRGLLVYATQYGCAELGRASAFGIGCPIVVVRCR
ncbi:hypothetical protein FKP32DRAFT_1587943 [Trametes sanguinea]|nr:hypothetical protein FKP32DRAFT_1587943 [Trametes sanguinea]